MNQEMLETIQLLDVKHVRPSPFQPRRIFRQDVIEDLAADIQYRGQLQAVMCRLIDDDEGGQTYELVIGESRLRAIRDVLKQDTIRSTVRELSDQEAFEICHVENLKRTELMWFEEYLSIYNYVNQYNFTHKQAKIGLGLRSSEIVSIAMRVVKDIQQEVMDFIFTKPNYDFIKGGHAIELIKLKPEVQLVFAKQIVEDKISVMKLRKMINKHLDKHSQDGKHRRLPLPGFIDNSRVNNIKDKYEANIKFNSRSNTGKVEIPFRSEEQFIELMEKLA